MSARDMIAGPGGEEYRPDLSHITFLRVETGGTNRKFRIKDGSGNEWVAKPGKEAQAETVAVRLLWAAGYKTEINYLVPVLTIPGKGTFKNVRLEARPKDIKRLDEWRWQSNPFVGTRSLQGLKVIMALMNNWDLKDVNNKILRVQRSDNGSAELDYIISDLGASFGKSSGLPFFWRITRSRNNPNDYLHQKFISEVKNGRVYFAFRAKNHGMFDSVTVDDARWTGELLSHLTPRQISDAFRAANYTPREVEMLTGSLRSRIQELLLLREGWPGRNR